MEMGSLRLSLGRVLLLFLSSLVIATTTAQPDFFYSKCSDQENYTNHSPFKKNLDIVLSTISSNSNTDTRVEDYGFYNATSGVKDPDRANAKVLCRKGVLLEQCRSCVKDSVSRIIQNCPNQKAATGWYSDCQILYSNNSVHGEISISSGPYILYNVNQAPDAQGFNEERQELLDRLREEAASGSSIRKSAGGDLKLKSPNTYTIYALVDCFPDMSFFDCDVCLSRLQSSLPNGSIGAKLVVTSCTIGYEIHPIYASLLSPPPQPSPPPTPPPTPPNLPSTSLPSTPGTNGNNNSTTVIIVVVSIVSSIILILVAICIILRSRNRKHRRPLQNFESDVLGDATDEISSVETIQFDFETIKVATNDFSNQNKLGQGGFGAVYKGKLVNGQYIAVKRLAHNSQQGDVEFKNEVLLVIKLQHRNLVRLLGFCLQKSERILIYEFVPNASLDQFIFDFGKRTLLDWERRSKIITGVARGLLYLHEDSRLRIIHRDLKASNILLDGEMNPKIADFGMARLFEVDETQGNTSRIVGTYGYMAPEYLMHGQISVKSDVFSFGVLVLEIVSGKKNSCFRNGEKIEDLSSFAWKNWRAGIAKDVIDSTLSVGSSIEMLRCIHIGLLCVQENATDRPTMASVVLMLSSFSLTLPIPSEPAFFMHSNIDESNAQSKMDRWLEMGVAGHSESIPLQSSSNEASISELNPR